MKRLGAAFAACFVALSAFAAEKTVTWNLPANWAEGVTYPAVEGYRAIAGEELLARGGAGASVGEPDLPYYRVRLALPTGGTFKGLTADVTWEPVDLGGALPIPVMQPVPTSEEPTLPAPGAAYRTLYPSVPAVAGPIERVDGVAYVPVTVSPFKWEGSEQKLYRATFLTVTATFDVVAVRRAAFATATPSAVANGEVYYGDDQTADTIIITPPAFTNEWFKYAEFRKGFGNGIGHSFAIKSTAAIYKEYESVGGDDAFKIHRYLEDLYENGKGAIRYVILGSAPKKYEYDSETMVPSRYIVVGSSLGQVSDEYYGCMDRRPFDSAGNEQGVEVWDYDGDGAYMGHKNANGSYSCDSADKIDWTQEIAVMRVPLMEEVVETSGNTTCVLHAREIMDNFIAKIRRVEDPDFAGRGGASFSGSTGFATSTYSVPSRSEMYTAVVDERRFFDGSLNMFDPQHGSWSSDSEIVPRDRDWEFFSYLRGNDDDNIVIYNSSYSKSTYDDMYDHNGDVFHILAHGWARGCAPGSGTSAFFATGLYAVYNCPIPCDSGMMDYCPSGSYGITNCICFGEAPILSPNGGSIAAFNNTRLGWSATFAMSGNNGNGAHSHRMDWLLQNAMSGKATGTPMNAADALKYAKNNFNAGYYATAAWGLSGLEVTGQGDPFTTYSKEYARTWKSDAANNNWSTNDANWTISGQTGDVVCDFSTDLYVDHSGKGSVTNTVINNLSSAGLFVKQDEGATFTLTGPMKYRATRETVITNGNVRWEVAGGAGRNGITFVGSRGNLILPGDRPRYFGDKFTNVGDIKVTGGNVVIDTPRSAVYGSNVDFASLSFVGDTTVVSASSQTHCTNNIFRTRTASFLPAAFTIPVVNSELILQATDNPILVATNATITVQANPLYENCYFARPIYLNNATLSGDYVKFGLGNAKGEGFDLYVSGTNRITGTVPILLNGELRIHYADADAVLEIENPLCDGVVAGSIALDGAGTLKLSGTQTFTTPLTIGKDQTLECTVAEAIGSSLTIAEGGTLKLDVIPFTGLTNLTVQAGGTLKLPEPTYTGTYKIVDATTTTLDIQTGAKVYDKDGNLISGEQTQGHYVLADNQLVWQASGETWDLDENNTTAWQTASGVASAYTDNSPLKFPDFDGDVTVNVGASVAPGFVDFKNTSGTYTFNAVSGASPTITFNSLIANTPITFNVPVTVPGGIMATGSASVFGDMVTPKVEIASGAQVEVSGTMQIPSQKMTKLRFEFSGTRTDGNRAAINELRLFNASGRFYLPVGTVITDIAGQTITVQEGTQGTEGQVVTGDVGDEKLSALVDGTLTGGNKWWASKSASPTWFEISFPTSVVAVTGYSIRTADQEARDPKDWKVYAMAEGADRYSLVATESGRTHNARRDWMLSGAAVKDRFPLAQVAGLALVRAGGQLVLDGTWCADLDLKADAVLKVIGNHSFTNTDGQLYLPDSGTVKVDLSEAASSATAFPVLTGFNITAAQFASFECATDTAMLLLKDGDIYAATDNVMVPPYTATVSASGNWSALSFTDSKSQTFTWGSANIKSSGAVTLNVTADSTITLDAVGTIASLAITGSKALTVNAADGVTPLAPAILDDSAHTGALVWNCPIGSTAVKAGAATTINGGTEGTGLLTVGANKNVTLGDGVTFANRDIDSTAAIRFAGTRTDFTLADWSAATYSFEDGTLIGTFTLPTHTVTSEETDKVTITGNDGNYYARSLFNTTLTGGTIEIDSNGDTTWFGQTAEGSNPTTAFTQSGGTFRCLANGTSPGTGLLVGYQGSESNELTLDLAGGVFEVPNSFLSFGTDVRVNLRGSAVMRAKGYSAGLNAGAIYLGTNVANNACSLEIGSLGFNAGAATLVVRDEAALVGYEPGAFFEGAIVLQAYRQNNLTSTKMRIGAKTGASLALRNTTITRMPNDVGGYYNGYESVVFGDTTRDCCGTVIVEQVSCLPEKWEVYAGTVDFGTVRASTSSELTSKPTNGRISYTLTGEEYESGASIELLRCSSWASSLTTDDFRTFMDIQVQNGDGTLTPITDGTLKCLGNVVNFIPEGATGYVFPISATVTANTLWSSLTWYDRNGTEYTNDWTGVRSAELVNESGSWTVTMDRTLTLRSLATRVASGKQLTIQEDGSNKLTLTDRINDSSSSGTTVLNVELGAGVAIVAGKNLQVKGASSTEVEHGTLVIGSGCVATVMDGVWNGAVQMADSTATLRYSGTTNLPSVPSSIGATVGTVEYRETMTPASGEATFGSASSAAASGNFTFENGGSLVADNIKMGLGNGTVEKIYMKSGSSIGAASETTGEVVLGNDLGSSVGMWLFTGSSVSMPNAMLWVGKQGTGNFQLRSTAKVLGVTNDVNATDGKLRLSASAATLEFGAPGIHLTFSDSQQCTIWGTLSAVDDAEIKVSPGMASMNMRLKAAAGKTLTVNTPIVATDDYGDSYSYYVNNEGEGRVILNYPVTARGNVTLTSGTLRLAEPELLNNSPVVFGAGAIEVLISRDQAVKSSTYKLFKTTATADTVTTYTKVLVRETGSEVTGTFDVTGGYATFTPEAITGIKATTDGVIGAWEDQDWVNGSGEAVDPAVWNSVIGTATLTNKGESDLTFSSESTITTLTTVNGGTLAIDGTGTMTVTTVDDSSSTGRTVLGAPVVATSVKAGADTVIANPGTGTLTIGSGKCATIPSWPTIGNVTGEGKIVFDAGAKDTTVTWGAGQTSTVSGTNVLARGTWTHTTTDTYPRNREVLVKGGEAVLKFMTTTDISGYAGYSNALTLEDGGTWLVNMRDTFSRPLYLVNGGHVKLSADNTNNGRALDMFTTSAKIYVRGTTPSTIGGQADDETSTTASGIVAIRRSGFTIDVAEGSTLKVYSAWSTASGSGGNFYKTGDGVMEQYRASSSALPFVISAGTLRLFGEGNVTTAGITNNATLEVNVAEGATRTWTTAVSGTGAFVKSGAGALKFGTARPTYGIAVEGGKLSFTLTAAEKNARDWIPICTLADEAATNAVEVLDVGEALAANVVATKVENRVYSVKVETYRMPITLTATTPVAYDWMSAPWKDASGTVNIGASDWEELLTLSNLSLAISTKWALTLNVNTNITATGLALTGEGALTLAMDGVHTLEAPITGSGNLAFTGKMESPDLEKILLDGKTISAGSITNTDAWVITNGYALAITAGTVAPFTGGVKIESGATLKVTGSSGTTIPVSEKTLTIDENATLTVNGIVRPSWSYSVADGTITLESIVYSANVTKDTPWANGAGEGLSDHGNWVNDAAATITLTNGADVAVLTFDTDTTAAKLSVVNTADQTLTLGKTESAAVAIGAYDLSAAEGTVAFQYAPSAYTMGEKTILVYDYMVDSFANMASNYQYHAGSSALAVNVTGSKELNLTGGDFPLTGLDIETGILNISGDAHVTTPKLRLGNNYQVTSTVNQSGGTLEVTGSNAPTNTSADALFAHWDSTVNYNLTGGELIVTNTTIRYGWDGVPTMTVNGGTMTVKGIRAGYERSHDATFTLTSGTLNLGSDGILSNNGNAKWYFNGGAVVACEDSAINISAGTFSIGGDTRFAAMEGKTLTVSGTVSGTGSIDCGYSDTYPGNVVFTNATLTSVELVGAFTYWLSAAQSESILDVVICKAPGLDTDKVTVFKADGTQVPNSRLVKKDGSLVVEGATYTMPLTSEMVAGKAWAEQDWVDAAQTVVPARFWTDATNATVSIKLEADAEVTVPSIVSALEVSGSGTLVSDGRWPTYVTGLTDDAWTGTLRISNMSGCTGNTGKCTFDDLGNANSTVEMNGVSGWFNTMSTITSTPFLGKEYAYTLKIGTNGFTVGDGSSGAGFGFAKLTGSGTLSFGKAAGNPTMRMVVKDATGFTGKIAVVGNAGLTVGTPSSNPDNGKLVIANGATANISPTNVWTAVNGIVFQSDSTLNVLADGSANEYTVTTSALTYPTDANLAFNGAAATRSDWVVSGGKLVKPTALASHTVNDAESYLGLRATSAATLTFEGEGVITATEGLVANATVTLDVAALDGTNMAKNAVCGAPYSRWLVMGPVSGSIEVTNLPSMPTGYSVKAETLADYGVRLVVTARDEVKLGAVSLNFAGGRSTTWDSADAHVSDNAYATDKHGAQPILGSDWIDLSCQNATTTTNGLTITVSGVNNPYNTARTASPRILYGYADDSKSPLVEISGITYDKYRVILYRSTDSTGTNYSAAKIGTTEADAVYYNGPTSDDETGGYTVPNSTQVVWGDTDANVLGEGVNYVVSDVLTGGTAYIYSQKHAGRAGVAAIQIVEVGELYTGPFEEETIATTLSYRLPGTETKQAFDYVYHAFGNEDDHTWAETSNWATVEVHQNTDGSVITNYTMYAANTNAPALPGSEQWVPIVINGSTVTATTLEGWNGRYGLYNGAQVTVDTVKRWQSDGTQMFVAVDETSRLTIKNELSQNNSNNSINYHVAAPSGIVYQTKFANAAGLAVNYYLEGEGSVCYEKGFTTGTHTIKACTIELGDASLTGKAVMKKYLVVGSGTVGTNGLVVTAIAGDGGLAGTPAPIAVTTDAVTTADVGSYCVTNDTVGTYITWVAYATGVIEVHPSETAAVIATTDTNLIHVVSYYTNGTEEVKLDLTSAFVMSNVTGGVQLYLNPAGMVEVKTVSGVETNSVIPELGTIAAETEIPALQEMPFVVADDQVAVGVKTIPGLRYQLWRNDALADRTLSDWGEKIAEKTAEGPRTKLVDEEENRPADKAFYIIRVTR